MFVRAAEIGDEKFLWAMLFEATHAREQGMVSPDDLREVPELVRYVHGWGAPGDCGLVGGADGVLLGAAWLRQFDSENPAYAYLDDDTPELVIAVVPESRGTGLGTTLLTGLLGTARETHSAVSLSVRLENPARRLYQRLGFVDVPGRTRINRAGTVSVVMRLDLA